MADDPLTSFVRTVVGSGVPILVLSPHLDDAVLSCGGLLGWAGRRAPVTVASLFTEAAPPPYTLSARRYLRRIGAEDAEELFAERRAEDRRVLERLDVRCRHAGLVDGLFRRPPRPSTERPAGLLPGPAQVCPTGRPRLSRGRMSPHDAEALRLVGATVDELLPRRSGGLLLAPLGVGGHADHVLVRTAAEESGRRVVYYSEFPYNQHAGPDARFTGRHRLVARLWERGLDRKAELIRGYGSQAADLFPDGRIPCVPEAYLLPDRGWPATKDTPRPPTAERVRRAAVTGAGDASR
ncbi:PIG-L deacetylase family protein [Streptomyces aureus]|uniref:PIG-L deacetylase family protein n=1 Tax=Streptomyces aureus TaxID=193461 RepID=UPI0006E17BA0|nr:PIG-L family deacetylase [Streptomyces aureus]